MDSSAALGPAVWRVQWGAAPPHSPWTGDGTEANCVKLQCSSWSSAPRVLPCGSEGELQYLQQLRWSAAVLVASEKEYSGASGTGAGTRTGIYYFWQI